MTFVRKMALCALVAVAVVSAGLVRPAPAQAATPCWKLLLNDWYDGRIDNTYALHCYQDALKHLPADVQTYSSAHDDILRALQNAKAQLRRAGKKITPNVLIVPVAVHGGTTTTTPSSGHPATTTTGTTPVATTPDTGRSDGKGLNHLADKLNPSNPSSLPLPLLVLGGLAILLVAAGAAGLLAKRYQGRNPSP